MIRIVWTEWLNNTVSQVTSSVCVCVIIIVIFFSSWKSLEAGRLQNDSIVKLTNSVKCFGCSSTKVSWKNDRMGAREHGVVSFLLSGWPLARIAVRTNATQHQISRALTCAARSVTVLAARTLWIHLSARTIGQRGPTASLSYLKEASLIRPSTFWASSL